MHVILSERLKSITDVFGKLPDVIEDVWISVANNEKEEAEKIIDNVPLVHSFENRYNKVENVNPPPLSCSRNLKCGLPCLYCRFCSSSIREWLSLAGLSPA